MGEATIIRLIRKLGKRPAGRPLRFEANDLRRYDQGPIARCGHHATSNERESSARRGGRKSAARPQLSTRSEHRCKSDRLEEKTMHDRTTEPPHSATAHPGT